MNILELNQLNKSLAISFEEGRNSLLKRNFFLNTNVAASETYLSNLNLNIASGEKVEILSTEVVALDLLAKIMAGIVKPDSGRISVLGKSVYITDKSYLRRPLISIKTYLQSLLSLYVFDGSLEDIYKQIVSKYYLENILSKKLVDADLNLLASIFLYLQTSASAEIFILPLIKESSLEHFNWSNLSNKTLIWLSTRPSENAQITRGHMLFNKQIQASFELPNDRSQYIKFYSENMLNKEQEGQTRINIVDQFDDREELADDQEDLDPIQGDSGQHLLSPEQELKLLRRQEKAAERISKLASKGSEPANQLSTSSDSSDQLYIDQDYQDSAQLTLISISTPGLEPWNVETDAKLQVELEIRFSPNITTQGPFELDLSLRDVNRRKFISFRSAAKDIYFEVGSNALKVLLEVEHFPLTAGRFQLTIGLHKEGIMLVKTRPSRELIVLPKKLSNGMLIDQNWGEVFADYQMIVTKLE